MYVLFQLIILRPHPHFTRHVRKKNPQNHPHFTRLKIHRSADPHFTGGRRGKHCRFYQNNVTKITTSCTNNADSAGEQLQPPRRVRIARNACIRCSCCNRLLRLPLRKPPCQWRQRLAHDRNLQIFTLPSRNLTSTRLQ